MRKKKVLIQLAHISRNSNAIDAHLKLPTIAPAQSCHEIMK